MSFVDQIRLFSQAKIVVAPHGAGLINTIFAPQNLNIIELFTSFGHSSFLVLSNGLGFQYACLSSGDDTGQYSDIMVDVAKLRALVADMLHLSNTPNLGGDRQPIETAY
jgi:hypothetical protein